MKTNYLTLFFIVATFAVILILFYFITKDVFYYPSKIKAGNKIDEVIIVDQVWKSTNLDLDTFRNKDLTPNFESDEPWVKVGDVNPSSTLIPNPTPSPTPSVNKITDIDGNQYDVIKIGTMYWAQKNLDVTKFRNGDMIKNAASEKEWEEAGQNGQPAWCYYENDFSNGKVYGKLYNWYAVNDSRGLCPTGWHVPSDKEWTALTNFLGGENIAGGKLKSIQTSKGYKLKSSASNIEDFSALLGGYCNKYGSFDAEKSYACFWTSTEFDIDDSWFRSISAYSSNVNRKSDFDKSIGASVRCLKD